MATESPETHVTLTLDELSDLVSRVVGMASAYEKYASRHKSVGKAEKDPFYSTRIRDFKAASERATQLFRNKMNLSGEPTDGD